VGEEQVLRLLTAAAPAALTRAALRQRLRLRNQRLGVLLQGLEAAGRIRRAADGWAVVNANP
jgi:hypothetical protein